MLARIRKSMQEKDQGFTLIELLVVIIIIGILAAIAIPVFLNQRKKGWDSQARSDARNIATLQETKLTEDGEYAVASTKADMATALPAYKPSANVTDVVMENYGVGATTRSKAASTGTAAAGGFCVSVQSKSAKWFTYDSLGGGILPDGTDTQDC